MSEAAVDTTIRIIAEPQMNANECKFYVEKPILEGGSFGFNNKEEANGSAIAEELFNVAGVGKVFVSANSVTVTRAAQEDWRIIGKEIGQAIRSALSSGKTLVSEAVIGKLPPESDIRVRVTEIINDKVNPAVASHGGFVELVEIKFNDVYLKMGGGCQGCSSAAATVKQGIEQMLRKEIPYLGNVIDVTDHEKGANPYFK